MRKNRGGAPRSKTDVLLVALAVVFAAPTLLYPYGRDQGEAHYVGREWLLHGRLPYRDLCDTRPPLIDLIYGTNAALFGHQTWFPRAVDLVITIAVGFACAALVLPRGRRIPRGLAGLSALYAVVQQYGFFDFWNTAQIDFLSAAMGFFAFATVHRSQSTTRAAVYGGLLSGLSILAKPSGIWLAAIAAGLLVLRETRPTWRSALSPLLRFSAALAVLPGLFFLYLWKEHALSAFYLWSIRVNGYWVTHGQSVKTPLEILAATRSALHSLDPFATVFAVFAVAGVARRFRRRDRPGLRHMGFVAVTFLAAWFGIVMQLKFFRYHVAQFVPPMTLLAATLFRDFRGLLRLDFPALGKRAVDFGLLAVASLFALGADSTNFYFDVYASTLNYAIGNLPRSIFLWRFNGFQFNASLEEDVGNWLRAHSRPTDSVAVRGFEPAIYVISDRSYAGRFFWTNFITDRRMSPLHDEWLAEIDHETRTRPPRFVVTIRERGEVVGTDWHVERAPYVERARFGEFRILELDRPR